MTALSEKNRYQAYPEYKDSGVEWSDTLPLSWGEVNLRWISTIYAGGTPSKTNQSFWENGTVPWINSGAVNQGLVTKPSTLITEQAYQNSSAKWIPKGSLVVALAGQGKTKGMVAQLAIDSTCNQSMGAIVPECSEYSRYLYWWITSNYQNIRNMAGGDLRDGLNLEHLGSIQCPQPSIDESVSIANFLDHETAKIDTLIEKQQQLIKLLKEKRQAVISHAVTKGLNPQAPMKDSGVEWLGEVPEHWKIVSVRNLIRGAKLQIQDGNHGELHPVANDYVDDGIPFLMANNVRNGKVDTSSCKRIPKALADKLRIGFAKVGDMLLTHKGTVGEVGIIPEEMREDYWMLTPQVTYYRWLHHSLHNEFFYYQFQSVSVATQLDIIAGKQSTRGYVGLIAQGDIELAIPPLNEQLEIASQLQADVKKHEDLIQKAEKLVLLQKERRTALISAAVTGKIDVRNWQAPISQDQALEQTA